MVDFGIGAFECYLFNLEKSCSATIIFGSTLFVPSSLTPWVDASCREPSDWAINLGHLEVMKEMERLNGGRWRRVDRVGWGHIKKQKWTSFHVTLREKEVIKTWKTELPVCSAVTLCPLHHPHVCCNPVFQSKCSCGFSIIQGYKNGQLMSS